MEYKELWGNWYDKDAFYLTEEANGVVITLLSLDYLPFRLSIEVERKSLNIK